MMVVAPEDKIPIGVSACLVGENVRYDGGHKKDRFITDILSSYFDFVPICPETELGLGIPRPTLRLEKINDTLHLIQPKNKNNITDKMQRYSNKKVTELICRKIYGYILKSRSPSCGMGGLKIYTNNDSSPDTNGVGIFAATIMNKWPLLPIEEEARLNNLSLRENWIKRVFCYYNFEQSMFPKPSMGKLVAFHSRYKFSILCHHEPSYRQMGRLVAEGKKSPIKEVTDEYKKLFMTALKREATRGQHINVLEHLLGFFKKEISNAAKRELIQSIEDYRQGYVPLIVPVTLIHHYSKVYKLEYVAQQAYLNPHPSQLALLSCI